MDMIDNTLADLAPWRAMLTKAQFIAKVELVRDVEEYLVGMLFRARELPEDFAEHMVENGGSDKIDSLEDLRTIGDQCLICAGLFPELALRRGVPITYFVKVSRAAYEEYGQIMASDLFPLLAAHLVDIVGVLQTAREIDNNGRCMDAINAHQLWQDTGSVHAWQTLQRFTDAIPAPTSSTIIH